MLLNKIQRTTEKLKSVWHRNNARQPNEASSKILNNAFNRQHDKKALVSFIKYGINDSNNFYHTNSVECKTICELVDELGYNVDLIDYDNNEDLIENKYDLVIGFGFPIENLLLHTTYKKFKLIIYRNGCDHSFADHATLLRIEEIYRRTGRLLIESSRLAPASWRAQIRFADLIIALGNEFVANTFKDQTACKIASVDLFYFDVGNIDLEEKNYVLCKNKILWFGSLGAIHKGLDLLIDYVSSRPQIELFICGLNTRETGFADLYNEAFLLPNIHNLGFIELRSQKFRELLYACGAIVLPSVSEGTPGSLLNVVAAGGLLPIITKNCGISFCGNEITIEDLSQGSIADAIESYLKLSPEQLKSRTCELRHFVRTKHTYNSFRNGLKKTLSNVLEVGSYTD